ncbi:MAG: glycerol-3-phosphate acyltransferase [Candidatus Paceibacterota bacterium]
MNFTILLILGYLIGSVSPGYFFGRLVRKIDIRDFGNHNTGSTNTYKIVGPIYGILAGVLDFIKAPVAYYLGTLIVNPDLAILVGLAAVVGHIFPLYLKFRGGRGVASLFGLNVAVLLFTQSLFALFLLAGTIVYAVKISHSIELEAPLRKILKLAALFFPLGLFWLPSPIIFRSLLFLFLALFVFDILRFFIPQLNRTYLGLKKAAKEKETSRLSGYTIFLGSAFAALLIFPEHIAIPSLVFFILGDTLAPIGQKFIPIPLLRDKTVGGLLIIFLISIAAGVFLKSLTPIFLPMNRVLLGALFIAVLDQFSFIIDDNLLLPLGTATFLTLLT